jgi:Cdc6-like AAA superfamily ATPase
VVTENINSSLNRCFMRFENRAERMEPRDIVDTFVSVGPLLDVLGSNANQIMYGRRGTGKTHALKYFEAARNELGDIAIYVDCQNIGSNQSIYNDPELSVSERATRLLIDVCSAMHWCFLDTFSDVRRGWSLSEVGPLLDRRLGGRHLITIS